MHDAAWCDEREFVVIPAAPPIVGACLGSLANSHAPSTIGRDWGFSLQPLVFNQPFADDFCVCTNAR
jgi:hypothetical protein